MNPILLWTALILAGAASTGSLLSRSWRWSLGLLAAQYLGIFLLVLASWPVSLATVKLVAGWMACAVLGIARLSSTSPETTESHAPQSPVFQLFTAGMVLVVAFSLATKASGWLGASLQVTWAGLVMIGMGLLHLGLINRSFRVIIALLTVLGGFEVLYAAVENSTLVAALLVLVNLGLAMAGAYFLVMAEENP
jgi:hypothetical protein